MNADRTLPGDWYQGRVPDNVELHPESYLETTYSFELFRSQKVPGVRLSRGSSVYLGVMFDLGPQGKVSIGEFSLVNGGRIICDSEITIGDYCLLSWNIVLMDTYRLPHQTQARRTELEAVSNRQPRWFAPHGATRPIHIGSNVWIGFESCILPGVSIGEGSVVGARSVVVEDVPAYTLVAGNPARVLRPLDPPTAPANSISDSR